MVGEAAALAQGRADADRVAPAAVREEEPVAKVDLAAQAADLALEEGRAAGRRQGP